VCSCVLVEKMQGCGVGESQRQDRVRSKCEILARRADFLLALVRDPLKYSLHPAIRRAPVPARLTRTPPPSTSISLAAVVDN
jgi:hypothetical protein